MVDTGPDSAGPVGWLAGGGVSCPLFVELCAGTAALSLRLHHPRARPPVSRMGAKTGYADVILRVLGLRPGQGSADRTHYLWAEPDAGVRLLLEAYRSKELAMAAADIIRGWKDEDPKALWLRLRDEGPPKGPEVDPREVARWAYWKSAQMGGAMDVYCSSGRHKQALGLSMDFNDLATLPSTITDDARKVDPPQLPAGTVAYMDPPYQNTTGYAHDLGRDAVVELARKWSLAGALVCISEAEPIHALVADGWKVVEITGERKGQKRTFSKQQREYLTISRDPAWRPSVQGQLFG